MIFSAVTRFGKLRRVASLFAFCRSAANRRNALGQGFWGWLFTALLVGTSVGSTIQSTTVPPPVRVKGSYVIAAICRDGIIVASDSRGMLKDVRGRRIAYYDTNQKIFPLGNKIIADTGYASLNDPQISFLSALMFRFADTEGAYADVDEIPHSYFQFAERALPRAGADSAKFQTLMFAGYKGVRPELCIYEGQSTQKVSCTFSGYLSSPRQQISGLKDLRSLSFDRTAQIMRKTIEDYAAAVQPGLVGGPVVLRIITRTASEWLGGHPEWPRWTSFSDLDRDYTQRHVLFHLMPGVAKTELDTLVDAGSAWAKAGRRAADGAVPAGQ
jgi:hypothetical protein